MSTLVVATILVRFESSDAFICKCGVGQHGTIALNEAWSFTPEETHDAVELIINNANTGAICSGLEQVLFDWRTAEEALDELRKISGVVVHVFYNNAD